MTSPASATNRRTMCTRLVSSLAAGTALLCSAAAWAAYPEKAVTLVVPFAPGGSSDIIARSMAPLLSERGSAGIHVKNRRNKLKSLSPLTFLTLA